MSLEEVSKVIDCLETFHAVCNNAYDYRRVAGTGTQEGTGLCFAVCEYLLSIKVSLCSKHQGCNGN